MPFKAWHSLVFVVLVILIFFPRVLDLDAFRAPDEKRWVANTTGFTRKLAHGQWNQLLQQPHPGITTQWLGSLTVYASDRATQKLPLVIGQGLLILAVGYIFARLWGIPAGAILTTLLAINPVLYAHSRIYAMDSLLSLFLLLSLGLLLLWHKTRQRRYLLAAGVIGAAAVLSKLPGTIIAPYSIALIVYWDWLKKDATRTFKPIMLWLASFLIGAAVILPSFALDPVGIIGDFAEFFRSDDYQQLHHLGARYYLGSLAFYSTPAQWFAGAALALFALTNRQMLSRQRWQHLVLLLLFATLFVVGMTIGAKKGDRYILPSFITLDVVATAILSAILTTWPKRVVGHIAIVAIILVAVVWQVWFIFDSHPHTLAYVNPLSRPWHTERRHGWGEGLDLAAAYLNQKQGAHDLKVASFYPSEFGDYFVGETVPAHEHDHPSVDYVVLYRAMLQRGDDAWETDVLNQYQENTPEKIITLSGVEMVWIHAVRSK